MITVPLHTVRKFAVTNTKSKVMFCFVVLLSCAVGMDTFCLALVVVLIVIKSNSHICEIHYFSSVLALPFQMYGRYDSTSNFSKKPKLLFSVDLVLQFYFLLSISVGST